MLVVGDFAVRMRMPVPSPGCLDVFPRVRRQLRKVQRWRSHDREAGKDGERSNHHAAISLVVGLRLSSEYRLTMDHA